MKNYPDFSQVRPADHLLFDIGYSTALLWRTKQVLQEIAECGDYPVAVDELLQEIAEFEAGRLKVRSEIYDNADEAVQKGCLP